MAKRQDTDASRAGQGKPADAWQVRLDALLGMLLSYLESDDGQALISRVSLLLKASWVPESIVTDLSGMAGMLGMQEEGARDLADRRNIPAMKPGAKRLHRVSDILKEFGQHDDQE